MGRLVKSIRKSNSPQGGGEPEPNLLPSNATGEDTPAERILKYIPAEVIAFYVAADGILQAVVDDNSLRKGIVYWTVFGLGLVGAPAYVWHLAAPGQPKRIQMLWASWAFLIWAYTLGGPFQLIDGLHQPYIGSLLLLITTLFAGLLPVPRDGQP